jgi:diguanylate cyclase (GGDEF)-like protein
MESKLLPTEPGSAVLGAQPARARQPSLPTLGRLHQLEHELFKIRAELTAARLELVNVQTNEKNARYLSLHDDLTSLPNRSYFRQRLERALADEEPPRQALAVLYLDLDGFKPLNDTHGHDAGDELLRIVAARLTHAVRAEDMVSRVGGDEFACMLTGLPQREQVRYVACKLFDAVSAPLKIGALEFSVRASIGIATCPTDGTTADSLLKCADAAMYRAKREGTGYTFSETCQ